MQVLKVEVRDEIVSAAGRLFAMKGFGATSIAEVAAEAGVSTGNVYRYFASKDALFTAVVPPEFATDVRRRTKAQIEALAAFGDAELDAIRPDSRYVALSEELVELTLAHRERIVILLARGEGTPVASFERDFRKDLVDWAFAYVRKTWPEVRIDAPLRFAVDRIYRSFLASLAAAFVEHEDRTKIRAIVRHLGAHHRSGLKALFRSAAETAKGPR